MEAALAILLDEDASRSSLLRLGGAADRSWETLRNETITEMEAAARRHAMAVYDRAPTDDVVAACCRRLWPCLDYHLRRTPEGDYNTLGTLISACEQGRLFPGEPQDLIADVILAQAMEHGQNCAARRFEDRYMPLVRMLARKFGTQRAADEIENYMADLYLRRDHSPARIGTYKGHTPLKYWLRTVVSRDLMTRARRKLPSTIGEIPECAAQPETFDFDTIGCRAVLKPLLGDVVAAVPAEDRLLLKLLLVDQVPQKDVARAFGINSANIGRRRDRAVSGLYQSLREAARSRAMHNRVAECLQSILAGEDAELAQLLGKVVAEGLRSDALAQTREGPK